MSSPKLRRSIHINHIGLKSQIKYLGVYIDQNLHWGPQIQHINNKLVKYIGIIKKLRHFVDLDTLKQLYYSFIYPYLTYGITSWGSTCKTRLQKIKTKQNKCVRSIFFAHSRDNAYYILLEILKLENIYKLKIVLFTHKITSGQAKFPAIFSRTLTLASEVHSYNTGLLSASTFIGQE